MPRLSAGITGTIFQRYLSVTQCPRIHQQTSKRNHSLWVFISGRLDIQLSHSWGRHDCLWKDDGGKGHLFYKIWTFLTIIVSTNMGDKPPWMDAWRGLVWPDFLCVWPAISLMAVLKIVWGLGMCQGWVCVGGWKEEKKFAESSFDEYVWWLVSDALQFQPESRLRWPFWLHTVPPAPHLDCWVSLELLLDSANI